MSTDHTRHSSTKGWRISGNSIFQNVIKKHEIFIDICHTSPWEKFFENGKSSGNVVYKCPWVNIFRSIARGFEGWRLLKKSRWCVNQRTRPRERDTFVKRPLPQNARLFLVKPTKPLCRYSTIGCHCALFGSKIFATKRNCFPRLGPLKPSATLASIIPNDWIRLHPMHRSYPFFATVRFPSSEFYETIYFLTRLRYL